MATVTSVYVPVPAVAARTEPFPRPQLPLSPGDAVTRRAGTGRGLCSRQTAVDPDTRLPGTWTLGPVLGTSEQAPCREPQHNLPCSKPNAAEPRNQVRKGRRVPGRGAGASLRVSKEGSVRTKSKATTGSLPWDGGMQATRTQGRRHRQYWLGGRGESSFGGTLLN